jgi:predicted RecA/RadA family phage recombinase
MTNYLGADDSIQIVATAAVVGGQLFKQGGLVGVIVADAAIGEQFTLKLEGAFGPVTKKAGEVWSKGDKLYIDTADNSLTKTAGALEFAGYAFDDALNADVTGSVLLKM